LPAGRVLRDHFTSARSEGEDILISFGEDDDKKRHRTGTIRELSFTTSGDRSRKASTAPFALVILLVALVPFFGLFAAILVFQQLKIDRSDGRPGSQSKLILATAVLVVAVASSLLALALTVVNTSA
jgi:hypothetical protein